MDLVYVEWMDHFTGGDGDDWVDIDNAADEEAVPLICRSVGWVLKETPQMLRLIANLNDDPDSASQGFGVFNIIKRDIRKRRTIKIR